MLELHMAPKCRVLGLERDAAVSGFPALPRMERLAFMQMSGKVTSSLPMHVNFI